MPTETKAPKETWRDWLIEDNANPRRIDPDLETLLDRHALVAAANEAEDIRFAAWPGVNGVPAIDTDDLRYWEYQGVLPRPIRRRVRGATRALYPDWMIYLLRQVRRDQSLGLQLDEIAPRMRALARSLASGQVIDQEIKYHFGPFVPSVDELTPTHELIEACARLAAWHERVSGKTVARIDVVVTDTEGRRKTHPTYVGCEPASVTESKQRAKHKNGSQ